MPQYCNHVSVGPSLSKNRTCGFAASGSLRQVHIVAAGEFQFKMHHVENLIIKKIVSSVPDSEAHVRLVIELTFLPVIVSGKMHGKDSPTLSGGSQVGRISKHRFQGNFRSDFTDSPFR